MLLRLAVGVLKLLVGLYVLAALLYAVPVVLGRFDPAMAVRFDRADPSLVRSYGNGLGDGQKATYYHLSQGSEILPWVLLTAIEVPDPGSSKPFVEDLARFGLLPDPARDDGLAVGLTLVSDAYSFGMEFVGITCAACHVGELRHGGKAIRVDGAPNMFNLQLFYSQAIDALMATAADSGKLWRSLKRLGRQDFERYNVAAPLVRPAKLVHTAASVLANRDKLKARLELIAVIRKAKEQRDPLHPTSGFGRLDAFDGTRNFLLTRLRKADPAGGFAVNTANMVKLDAPTKFPPVWSLKAEAPGALPAYRDRPGAFPRVVGFKDYDWIEWTLNTNTVMERNFTETLGAGATVVLDPAAGDSLFDSSIPIANLHELELLSYYIDPPRWPADLFGAVKTNLAATGEGLFKARCAGCHEYGDDRRTETGLLRLRGFAPEVVGTDPSAALRISCPVPDTGALAIPPRAFTAAQADLLQACAGVKPGAAFQAAGFAAVVQAAVDSIKRKAFVAAGIDTPRQRIMEDLDRRKAVMWRDTLLDVAPPAGPYAARPLHGIWAAAPYLHNGSVPTLYDLLSPPEQRPKRFALGRRDYDPVKLGFVVTAACAPQDCLVDTTRPGNGNAGHRFGTELGETERMALIEYLKTY